MTNMDDVKDGPLSAAPQDSTAGTGEGLRLSEIHKVTLHFLDGPPTSYLIPAGDVDKFVVASKRLHWRPGRNPHSKTETSKVWQITVGEMKLRGPFWWTVPDLMENDDPAGAHIIDVGNERIVFVDREITARWQAEQAEEEATHYREKERQARDESDEPT